MWAETVKLKDALSSVQQELRMAEDTVRILKARGTQQLPTIFVTEQTGGVVGFSKSLSQVTFEADLGLPSQKLQDMLGNIDEIASNNLAQLGIRHRIAADVKTRLSPVAESAIKTPSCNKQQSWSPGVKYRSASSAKTLRGKDRSQQTKGRNLFGSVDSPEGGLMFRTKRVDSDASSQLKSNSLNSSPIPKLSFGELSIKKTPKNTKREICKPMRSGQKDSAGQVTFSNEVPCLVSKTAEVCNYFSNGSSSMQSAMSKNSSSINKKDDKHRAVQGTPEARESNNQQSQGTPQLILKSGRQLMITPDKSMVLGLKGLSPINHPARDVESTNLNFGLKELDFFSPNAQNMSYAASLRNFLEKGGTHQRQQKYSSYAKGQMSSSSWKKMGNMVSSHKRDLNGLKSVVKQSSKRHVDVPVREFADGFLPQMEEA